MDFIKEFPLLPSPEAFGMHENCNITYAEAEALTTYGIIGIKVWIYKGEVFAREFSQETNKVTPREGKE